MLTAHVRDVHEQDRGDQEHVREGVDEEQPRPRHADGDEAGGQQRPEHTAAVDHHRVQAHGTAEVSSVHQQRHAGLEGGSVQGVADADRQGAGEQGPHRRVGADEDGQQHAERGLDRLHHDEVRAAGEAVGEDAGGDRQHQQGTELREHEDADERGGLRAVLDVGRQREVLHPRAHVGGEQAEPDPPEVAVRQRGPGGTRTVPVREDIGGRRHRS
jgi:hypothetical protein